MAWCDAHGRAECGRPKADGDPCHQAGDRPCRRHAEPSAGEVAIPGGPPGATAPWDTGFASGPVTPRQALDGLLQASWARWQHYAGILQAAVESTPGAPEEGLVGHTWGAADIVGGVYETGDATRPMVAIEADERDRAARLAKQMHDMGYDDD
jgi:hypothetical protein